MKRFLNSILVLLMVVFLFSCAKKQIVKPEISEQKGTEEKKIEIEEPKTLVQESDNRGINYEKSVAMDTIYFDYDKYNVREDSKKILEKNIEYLKANESIYVQLQGHCDERGTTGYNIALGQKRATSVRNYLIFMGIDGERISTLSYGEEMPVCFEHSEECWARNRRAEFYEKKKIKLD